MKVSTFADDLLGLEDFAHRLEKFIAVEHDYVEGSLVLALSSKFGFGKTTFLQMWKSSLESAEGAPDKPLVISLNAWESDYYGDPLFAIISGLVEALQKEGKPTKTLVNAAKDFGWFATAIGGQIVEKLTGIDPLAAGDLAEKKKEKREDSVQMIPDTFSIYEGRRVAMKSLKEAIQKFVAAEPRVLFLVDELDRCRPDYAITYLETIKHIFDIKGAVFLLAADRQQLENSARTAFGPKLDFEEYYRKFIHREITLPPISKSGYGKLASEYVGYYLEREGSRYCSMKFNSNEIQRTIQLVGALKLTPRQLQDVFRILGHIFESLEKDRDLLRWGLAFGSVAMAALKIGDPRVYDLLGSQQLTPKKAVDFLNSLLAHTHVHWWFDLFKTGGGLRVTEGETIDESMNKEGFSKNDDLGLRLEACGNEEGNIFSQIHKMIEQIYQWE